MEAFEKQALKAYIPLVDFIAGIVGPDCEVVLHDISNVNESIIAIRNNHISGRKVGGPLTDLGLKLLKDAAYDKQDFLLNYPSTAKNGKPLRSSTFFIKDSDGRLIGMLCINIDLTTPLAAKKFIDSFIMGCGVEASEADSQKVLPDLPLPTERQPTPESFSSSIEELIATTINNVIDSLNIPAERLSPEEKIHIVKQLNDKGVFLIKGSVSEVAKHLKVSENTVYRYLNKKD